MEGEEREEGEGGRRGREGGYKADKPYIAPRDYCGAPAARRVTKRRPILIRERKGNS